MHPLYHHHICTTNRNVFGISVYVLNGMWNVYNSKNVFMNPPHRPCSYINCCGESCLLPEFAGNHSVRFLAHDLTRRAAHVARDEITWLPAWYRLMVSEGVFSLFWSPPISIRITKYFPNLLKSLQHHFRELKENSLSFVRYLLRLSEGLWENFPQI